MAELSDETSFWRPGAMVLGLETMMESQMGQTMAESWAGQSGNSRASEKVVQRAEKWVAARAGESAVRMVAGLAERWGGTEAACSAGRLEYPLAA